MTIGVCTATDSYRHVAGRLRDELAQARSAQRRGTGTKTEVERLTAELERLKEDAAKCGIRL